jgi:hypothetical protein
MSGVLIGVAASSALFLPFDRLLLANRPATRISLARYTYVSIWIAIAIAVVLGVAAVLVGPQGASDSARVGAVISFRSPGF